MPPNFLATFAGMSRNHFRLKSFESVLLVLLSMLSEQGWTQEERKIRIINANSLEFNESRPEARRLIGDVIFEHNGTYLYCDSAYFYEGSNRMEAFSNVKIVSDSVVVTANQLNYNGSMRVADLLGNVELTDPGSRLNTNSLNYDLKNKVATYNTGGKIISNKNKNELTSIFGQYNANKRLFYFRKNVVLKNPDYEMRGDTLHYQTNTDIAFFFGPTTIQSEENSIYCENGFYNTRTDYSEFGKNASIFSKGRTIKGENLKYDRKTGKGIARENVVINDSANAVVLRGNSADYFEKLEILIVTNRAAMEKAFGEDTLFLAADTLKSITDTTLDVRTLFAYNNARFYKSDFQGKCDSLVYSEIDSTMRFFGNPVLWNEENQLTGDTVRIQLANDELKTLFLNQAAFILSEEDSLNYNQIKGRNIVGHFENSTLRKVDVFGNGQSLYYAKDEKEKYIGINKAECSDMIIYIDSNEVRTISFLKKPDATLYPINKLKGKELRLKGFAWFGSARPRKKEDIFIYN